MTAAIQAVTLVPLCYRNLQCLNNLAFKSTHSFEAQIQLDESAKVELQWWITEVRQWNVKLVNSLIPDMTIETDASLLRGALCRTEHRPEGYGRRKRGSITSIGWSYKLVHLQ